MLVRKELLFTLWLAFCVLRPYPLLLFGDTLAGRIMDGIALSIIMLFWLVLPSIKSSRIRGSPAFFFFVALFISQAVSFAWGNYMLSLPAGPRDLFELYRYPFLLLVFGFAYQMDFSDPKMLHKYVVRPFYVLGILVMGFVALQLLIPEFRTASTWLYGGNPEIVRPIGTFYNPNFLGMFFGFWLMLLIPHLLLATNAKRILYIAPTLLGIWFVLQTDSRTALVSATVGTLATTTLFLFAARRVSLFQRSRSVLLLVVMGCLTLVLFVPVFGVLSPRFQELAHGLEVRDLSAIHTLSERLEVWARFIPDYLTSPVLGMGPAKYAAAGSIFDNNYLNVLVRYGALGLAVFMSFLGYLLYRCVRMIGNVDSIAVTTFLLGFTGILVSLMVGMVTADLFSSQQLMGIVMAFSGVAIRMCADMSGKTRIDSRLYRTGGLSSK